MGVRVQADGPHPVHQRGERRIVVQGEPQRESVGEEADQPFDFEPVAVGDGRADDEVALSAPARQESLEGGEERHEGSPAPAAREANQLGPARRRELEGELRAARRPVRPARPVGGKVQRLGCARQALPPVCQLMLQRARRTASSAARGRSRRIARPAQGEARASPGRMPHKGRSFRGSGSRSTSRRSRCGGR